MGKNEKIDALYRIIADLNSAEECELLFEDLCTVQEMKALSQRMHACVCAACTVDIHR